jgi:hypothetical protein
MRRTRAQRIETSAAKARSISPKVCGSGTDVSIEVVVLLTSTVSIGGRLRQYGSAKSLP